MGRASRALVALLAVFLCWPGAASGEDQFIDKSRLLGGDRTVQVSAQRVSRQVEERLTVAEGAVEITSGQMRLRADRVELRDETMDLTALGNVLLEFGEDRLQGERLELNLRTEVGYVEEGEGFAQAFYFQGKRIDRLSADQYRVDHGRFTSCEGTVPDWSFHTTEALIDVGSYIYAWNPTLWVKKVPVLYLPYTVVPIKQDRATGFLVPRLRFHSEDGVIVMNSFFWAPVDNADATVYFDYYSRRGWRYGLEGNYVLSENTAGKLLTYYIDDHLEHDRRWNLQYSHRQELPWEVSGIVNIDYLSDRNYERDYGMNLEDISQERTQSYASLTRVWGNTTAVLSAERQESLVTAQKSVLTRWPELNVRTIDTQLGSSGLFLALRLQGVGLDNVRGPLEESTTRYDVAPKLSYPINVESWAVIKPSLELDYTYYTEDLNGEQADRFLYNPRLEITGPKFYQIFGEAEDAPKFKHLIYPKVIYSYLPAVDQTNLPRFDTLDRVATDNSITYSLVNQVLGKFPKKEGKTTTREVLELEVLQQYNLDPGAGGAHQDYLGDVVFSFDARPFESLTLEADAQADVNRGNLDTINYGFTWREEKIGSLNLDRRFSRLTNVDYYDAGVTIKPGNWEMGYRTRYDRVADAFVERWGVLKYTAQCWDATVNYIRYQDITEVRVMLNFKGIGTIVQF